MVSRLPIELQSQECYFKWVNEEFDQTRAMNIRNEKDCQVCMTKDYRVEECQVCKVDGEWRRDRAISSFYKDGNEELFMKFVSWNFEMTFLNAYIGDNDKAWIRLKYVMKKVSEQEEDTRGFMGGYVHVAKCLQAYLHHQQGNHHLYNTEVQSLKNFEQLDCSPTCAILNLKFTFFKTLQFGYMNIEQFNEMISVLKTLVKMQPKNSKWHELLGTRIRSYRRQLWKEKPEKSWEESLAFNTAYNLNPDVPRTVANYIRDVAERLRSSAGSKKYHVIHLQCGNGYFHRVGDALDFIKRETFKILRKVDALEESQLGEDISKALSVMAEIYSSNLPKRFLDIELAEKCIRKAHALFPNCAKVNHRFGIFLWDKRLNFQEAVYYVSKALLLQPKNFYALCDLIQICISRPHEKYQDLLQIFDEHFQKGWPNGGIGDLHFLKSCFLMATGGEDIDILQNLIKAQQLGSKLKLETLQRQIWRYRWKPDVSLEKFENVLKNSRIYVEQMETEIINARKNYKV